MGWVGTFVPLYLRITNRRLLTESWNTWTAPRPSQSPMDPPTWRSFLSDFISYFSLPPLRGTCWGLASPNLLLWPWPLRRRWCQWWCLCPGSRTRILLRSGSFCRAGDNRIQSFHQPSRTRHLKIKSWKWHDIGNKVWTKRQKLKTKNSA